MARSTDMDWVQQIDKSQTNVELVKAIGTIGVTDMAAIVHSFSFLCLKIDDLNDEIHKLKSRIGMLK